MTLFDTVAESGTSDVLTVNACSRMWVKMAGDWNSGSVAIQFSHNNSDWSAWTADGSAVSWTDDNMVLYNVPQGFFRFVATSVTSVLIYVRYEEFR